MKSILERNGLFEGTAVVTGATSGIGAAFAETLAAMGTNLILTGRREARLRSFTSDLEKRHGIRAEALIAELGDDADLRAVEGRIARTNDLCILINNAGFGQSGFFGEETDNSEPMVDVHIRAALRLTRAALPLMKSRGKGAVVFVSSMAAFFPMPKASAYSATKAFLNTFSEALHTEVRRQGILVQALCPGMTRTDFHERLGVEGRDIAQRNMLGWATAASVAQSSLRRLDGRRVVYVPGALNRFLVFLGPKLPRRWYYRLVQSLRT